MLSVSGLTMRFGGLKAVDALSFEARPGDITAIIGPNGAGKTTAFNCITGFYRPSEGTITLTHPGVHPGGGDPGNVHLGGIHPGDPVAGGARYALHRMPGHRIAAQARVARTFQNIRLFPGMTVLENMLVAQHNALMRTSLFGLAAVLRLGPYRAAETGGVEKARHWLDRIGLTERADDPAGALPYGAQRRLEIARALCIDPVLLCLDEPAAGLNPRETEGLNDLLLSIRADGCSLLLIEHDMGVVMRISDHIVVLDHGKKIADGTPAEVRENPAVIAAYLGEGEEDEEVA